MKPGEELKDGPPIHGNTRLEVFWTAIPAVLLLGLVVLLVRGPARQREEAGARRSQVGVTGQQFAWTLPVPAVGDRRQARRIATSCTCPKGESVYFDMHSKDVIHAFWIPAFRLQEDVVPGITTHYRATPDRLGTYPVVCNLLCGLGHSLMRSTVHVVPAAQFQAWLEEPAAAPASATGLAAARASTPGRLRDNVGDERCAAQRRRRTADGDTPSGSARHRPGYDALRSARNCAPGFYRAAWLMLLGVAFALGLTWLVRMSHRPRAPSTTSSTAKRS